MFEMFFEIRFVSGPYDYILTWESYEPESKVLPTYSLMGLCLLLKASLLGIQKPLNKNMVFQDTLLDTLCD